MKNTTWSMGITCAISLLLYSSAVTTTATTGRRRDSRSVGLTGSVYQAHAAVKLSAVGCRANVRRLPRTISLFFRANNQFGEINGRAI